ncbi:MAG: ATP-binding protein, partial [Roseomonas sp.]|nr:ATP-binding protein [Roseomonas sp.]
MAGSPPRKTASTPRPRPAEGSPRAIFAALLKWHIDAGTRPAGKNGVGSLNIDAFARDVDVSKRMMEYYRDGRRLPRDLAKILQVLFGDDPRHATARATLLGAFNAARGVAAPAGAVALSNIPIRIPTHFMGREEPLALIHAALSRYEGRVAITALHGLRGVGKTVLAAAYAEQQRATYRATWWLRAQTESTLRADLVGLGVRLGWVAADEKEEPALATVMGRLRQEGEGILLIYDNAIEARGLAPFLPRGGAARVIITSNAHAWRGVAEPVEIRLWPKAIGADYLIARTGRAAERVAAEALSEALGGLPLAHEQAAAYCERLDIGLAEYGGRLAAAPARLLDDARHAPAEYHDGLTVAKTFALAIEQAAALHPGAAPLIAHAALLPPEPIPLFLFEEGREALGAPLATLLAEEGLEEAIAALRAFALLDREAIADEREPEVVTETIRLHRLVRAVAASGEAATTDAIRRSLLAALAAVYPDEGDAFNTPAAWPRARRLDALALGLTGEAGAAGIAAEATATLLGSLASYRHGALAAYAAARPLFERALAIRETALGPDHPQTVISLNNLALLLQAQGDLTGARPLYDRALAIKEKALDPDHP